jgi:HEAT repeat protein
VDALAEFKPQGSSMILSRVAEGDPDIDLRVRAIRGMGTNVETASMLRLMKVAARGRPKAVAEAAREKLKELRRPESILSTYAGGRGVETARALGDMLEKTGDYEKQLEDAMGMIHDSPLKKKKPKASQPYQVAMRRLKDGGTDQRLTAAYDLGIMKRQESEKALREALKDEEPDVALAAADALGKIPNLLEPDKITELLDADVHERPSVRMAAARACGIVNPPPATEPLVAALTKERDTGVQIEMAEALGRLRPPEAKLPLLALLMEGAMPAKIKAVWAMGQLGDKTVCPALIQALEKAGPNDKELKVELAGALSGLTGQSLGTDAAKWRKALEIK